MNWHLTRNSWQTLLNRTTIVSPLCPNWNQRTLTTCSPSWQTVFTYKTRRWQWRDSGYTVHLGKCSFQQSCPPFFSSALKNHGSYLGTLNEKEKCRERRHCSAANITHLLVLLVLFTAMQISSGQTRVSRALADMCVFLWLGLRVCVCRT